MQNVSPWAPVFEKVVRSWQLFGNNVEPLGDGALLAELVCGSEDIHAQHRVLVLGNPCARAPGALPVTVKEKHHSLKLSLPGPAFHIPHPHFLWLTSEPHGGPMFSLHGSASSPF